MGPLRRRVAYLSGLAAGLNLSSQSPEGRVLAGVVEALEAMAEEIQRLDQRVGELAEYLGELDEDLYDLEESVAGDVPSPRRQRIDGRRPPAPGGDGMIAGQERAAAGDFPGGIPSGSQEQAQAVSFRGGASSGHGPQAGRPGFGDELILQCPRCGSSYAVSPGQLEFDREPDQDEHEFEWVCPHCGEVVHDYLPDVDVHEDDEPLTAQRTGAPPEQRHAGRESAPGGADHPASGGTAHRQTHVPSPAP